MLKKFLTLFVGCFLICLFIFMMQYMWRSLDELIGKGLSMDILAQFFWYMGQTLVPAALPLSVLLTSLITFGNLGESMELTAMKSAGIPLIRIMSPIMILCIVFGLVSFRFQNNVSPSAQKQLARMLMTMKETSPAIEIPEGVFYNGIPNINIYVKTKNVKTGMLYDVIIYKMDQGFENAQIVVADSAQLETTADKHFLRLAIFSGEQFENLRQMGQMAQAINVPYDRETFRYKVLLVDFDSGFELMDENTFSTMASAKNLKELEKGADSITHVSDSIGKTYNQNMKERYMTLLQLSKTDSANERARVKKQTLDVGMVFSNQSSEKRLQIIQSALDEVKRVHSDLEWEKPVTATGYRNVRRHWIEWHQKFALSLACLIFFFVGAPLGAIIRKGGLGLPAVISVIIFIIYYIINTSGMKLAREGTWQIWFGMWASTMVLAPLGAFVTYKANNDSVVFNFGNFLIKLKRFFGVRTTRLFITKEVVIETPDYRMERQNLEVLSEKCQNYIRKTHLPFAPNYFKLYFRPQKPDGAKEISAELEAMLERLSNSRDARLLTTMNEYPELYTSGHLLPFSRRGTNIAIGILFPIGFALAWRIWRFRLQLYRDLKLVIKADGLVETRIDKILTKIENNNKNE